MIKKYFLILIISLFFVSTSAQNVLAGTTGVGINCNHSKPDDCISGFSCQEDPTTAGDYICQLDSKSDSAIQRVFGKIQAPDALKGFLEKNPTGAGAISQFLSNGIVLIYSIAAIVLIFMILWGAFEWLTSGGDKEKLAGAQKRILHAIIGIILFAVAFAIIQVLGRFTGFTFFTGQK